MVRPRFEYDLDTIQEQSCCSEDEEQFDIDNIKTRQRALTRGYDSPTPKTQSNSQFFVTTNSNDKPLAEGKAARQYDDSSVYAKRCYNKLDHVKYKGSGTKNETNTKYRAKMIDWMIDVLHIFQQNEMTLYRSVDILDSFYAKTTITQTRHDLHLNGLVSLFIASKLEQTRHIKLDDLIKIIGKNKFTRQEILTKELEISRTLGFKLRELSLFDLLHCSIQLLDIKENKVKETITNMVGFVSKIFIFSSDMLSSYTTSEIAISCLILSLKLSAKLHSFPYKKYVNLKDTNAVGSI